MPSPLLKLLYLLTTVLLLLPAPVLGDYWSTTNSCTNGHQRLTVHDIKNRAVASKRCYTRNHWKGTRSGCSNTLSSCDAHVGDYYTCPSTKAHCDASGSLVNQCCFNYQETYDCSKWNCWWCTCQRTRQCK